MSHILRICRSTRPMTVSPPVDSWSRRHVVDFRRHTSHIAPASSTSITPTSTVTIKRLQYINSVLQIYQHTISVQCLHYHTSVSWHNNNMLLTITFHSNNQYSLLKRLNDQSNVPNIHYMKIITRLIIK